MHRFPWSFDSHHTPSVSAPAPAPFSSSSRESARTRARIGALNRAHSLRRLLEQNRAEAAAKKQKLKHKKYDWRKYKAAKKKEKVKRQVQKLLED